MDYQAMKTFEYRLDEARRAQRNAEFAMAVRLERRRGRKRGPGSFRDGARWTPNGLRPNPGGGGAA